VGNHRSNSRAFIASAILIVLVFAVPSTLPFSARTGTVLAADTVFYDFIAQAASASWSSAAGNLSFPGSETDSCGFALYRNNWQLEDNKTWARVLETHPQWVSNGWIMGVYPQVTVPFNAEIKVTVGFIKGATGSDGVIFEVRFEEFRGLTQAPQVYPILSHTATYDGNLDSLTASLGSVAGKTGHFILYVNAGQSSGQDWAVWAEAKIEIPPSDTTAPQITITHSPSQVTTADTVTFTARAKDESGVAKVSIFVNGQRVEECAPPAQKTDAEGEKYWECTYTGGPYGQGTLTYRAEAIDGYGNHGVSGEESVDVTLTVSQRPPEFVPCWFSISGKIMDFPYPREMLKIELCQAERMPLPPQMGGGTRWVCKSGGVVMQSDLMSHDTYRFDGLCPGTYLVTPVIRPYEGVCQPEGVFWNRELTQGGARVVNVPEENTADFVFVPRQTGLPEVTISVSPENATTHDEVRLIVNASGVSQITGIRIEGQIEKIWKLRRNCRTETHGEHEIEVCDEEEYGVTETILQECHSSPCIYTIPRDERNFNRYELSISVTVWDRLCNVIEAKQDLIIYDGYIPPAFPQRNERNINAYREREVFMVSDRDWRTVLSLIPIAYGTYRPGEGNDTSPPYLPAPGDRFNESDWLPDIKYPLLIFHQEPPGRPYNGSFDIDSAVLEFMPQYRPRYLTVFVGNEVVNESLDEHLYYWLMVRRNVMPSEARMSDNINWYHVNPSARIRFFEAADISDVYEHYFSQINAVIVCQDDYKTGLVASHFAALTNMPLYFDGHFRVEDIEGKVVHIVGNIRPATRGLIETTARALGTFYKGRQVVQSPYELYAMRFPTTKEILVSGYDIDSFLSETIRPRTGAEFEVRTFGANSLAAAVLAAATNRDIVFSPYEGVLTDDGVCRDDYYAHERVKSAIETIKRRFSSRYSSWDMVIVASPAHIPDSYYTGCVDGWAQTRHQVDREYGASGRIYGLTVTDTSAYIARAIFYNDIVGTQDVISTLLISHSICSMEEKMYDIFRDLRASSRYDVTAYFGSRKEGCIQNTAPPVTEYLGKDLIIFADHGSYDSWSSTLASWDIPDMDSAPVVFAEACLTNNFWQGGVNTMGPNWIRHGAMAYFGAVGVTSGPDCWDGYTYTHNVNRFMEEKRHCVFLGELSDELATCVPQCCGPLGYCWIHDCAYRNDYILLGDPCLTLNNLLR